MFPALIPDDYFRTWSVAEMFGAGEACEVDLGCGEGTFLSAMAAHYPERLFLGIERLMGRVGTACDRLVAGGLANARMLRVESRYFLEWFAAPGSVSRLHYLFPDPWPKKRHHKNRLVQEHFLPVLHRALAEGGEFLFKTDDRDYYDWVVERMDPSPLFTRLPWPEDAFFYPKTDFQRQWEEQGKPIFCARYVKKPFSPTSGAA